ncbi:kinase-like domain-containing protein [Stachybotrys elegans]|uniref:Kinase-like domain-containing protein n=1 Tax=Stachybotrys elegans TaxID=80388 RepID=A0A8K0T1W3_9HYPO|nr:kinase-like domain-containing protein [Stachybotrys elegans]
MASYGNGNHHPTLQQHTEILSSFHDFKERYMVHGLDGSGERRGYIPRQSLEAWWAPRIHQVLTGIPGIFSSTNILNNYLRVVSTLASIGELEQLMFFVKHGLTDAQWRQDEFPSKWPEFLREKLFKRFCEEYWTFFPYVFDRADEALGYTLPLRRILPLDAKRPFGPERDDNRSKLFQIEVNKLCNRLVDDSTQNKFVLKVYNKADPDQELAHEREAEAYHALNERAPENIVRMYSSFEQDYKLFLVMEFVDGINLEEYVKSENPPQGAKDVHQFWTSILGLPTGLLKLSQLDEEGVTQHRALIHQDMKLSNMVLQKEPDKGPYAFVLKLVDFEHSSMATTETRNGQLLGVNNHGNATNSAPEASNHDLELEDDPQMITPASDVWQMGCCLLRLAFWVVDGLDLVDTTTEMRFEESMSYATFRGSGYEGGYQNGYDALLSVRNAIKLAKTELEGRGRKDEVTLGILDIIDGDMLQPPERRASARTLQSKLKNLLDRHPPTWGSDSDLKRMISPVRSSVNMGAMLPPANRPSQSPTDSRTNMNASPTSGVMPSTGEQDISAERLKTLKDREHIILIDDSPQTKAHFNQLKEGLHRLLPIATELDPGYVELFFLSNPKSSHTIRKASWSRSIMKVVEPHAFNHDPVMTESRMDMFVEQNILQRIEPLSKTSWTGIPVISNKNPLSILILTTGCWGDNAQKAAGVEKSIKRIMEEAIYHKVARTKIMLQFLRLGNDQDGMRYLDHLDEMGKDSEYDIVDTRSIDDNLYNIFVGSIGVTVDKRR